MGIKNKYVWYDRFKNRTINPKIDSSLNRLYRELDKVYTLTKSMDDPDLKI